MRAPSGLRLKLMQHLARCGEASPAELAADDDSINVNSVYNLLSRMEKDGWASSRIEKKPGERNRPRRLYKLTPLGLNALEFARHQLLAVPPGLPKQSTHDDQHPLNHAVTTATQSTNDALPKNSPDYIITLQKIIDYIVDLDQHFLANYTDELAVYANISDPPASTSPLPSTHSPAKTYLPTLGLNRDQTSLRALFYISQLRPNGLDLERSKVMDIREKFEEQTVDCLLGLDEPIEAFEGLHPLQAAWLLLIEDLLSTASPNDPLKYRPNHNRTFIPHASRELYATIHLAGFIARQNNHAHITTEHLLLALLDDYHANLLIRSTPADAKRMRAQLHSQIALLAKNTSQPEDQFPDLHSTVSELLKASERTAKEEYLSEFNGAFLLRMIAVREEAPAAKLLSSHGLTYEVVYDAHAELLEDDLGEPLADAMNKSKRILSGQPPRPIDIPSNAPNTTTSKPKTKEAS